ncbi:MAG: dihydrolipoyl dehydrogenase [Bacteroidales bacterium]|nr:dihydrolipoyl dehydrogenase [Bacteroidales bacterium]
MRIIIIGAGPGGYETAVEAAKRGIEVTLVAGGPLGGTCLNEGCIPTKTFCHYSELIEGMSKAEALGITQAPAFDFAKVAERKEAVVAQLREGIGQLLRHKLITVVEGKASLKDAHTVVVDGVEYSGDKIIIATGSVSASLPIPGVDLPGVITSKEILELTEVPKRLAVIGGGVIGLEFASIFKSFGSDVSILEYAPTILPRFDTDLAKRLKLALGKRGIKIETAAQVTGVTRTDGGLAVSFAAKAGEASVEADLVLMAVGRRPNLESLNLADLGIEFSRRGIVVDQNMQTSVPDVYAIGDIVGGMMLAHAATFHGLRALNHICGQPDSIDFGIIPAAVFSLPEAACVGMTEDEAKAAGIAVRCLKSQFRANGKAVSMDDTEGFCKIVVREEDGAILGCHLFGPHSADIIQEVAALLAKRATLADLQDIIHAHPTLGEVIQSAAHSA